MGKQIVMRCHCGQLTETVLLEEKTPVKGSICHCNICRNVTGAMTFSGVMLKSAPTEVFKQKLMSYSTSEKITRLFCKTCGSHVAYHVTADDKYGVCSGAMDKVIDDPSGQLEEYTGHEYVADTKDGGLALCLPELPFYLEDDGQNPVIDLKAELAKTHNSSASSGEKQIEAQCHCGQVRFAVRRADDGKKHQAGICVCQSCRLSFSQPIVPWALNIPYEKIIWDDGKTYDGAHASVSSFQSSDHARRDFCPKCGASVFFDTSQDEGTVDVAFGILRPQEGSLARSFFKWDDYIHHEEDAIDQRLVDAMKNNLAALSKV